MSHACAVGSRGAVLLLVLVTLAGLAAALLWHLEAGAERELRERRAVSMAALVEAREALVGYALRDATRPGELPCPDYNRDGVIRVVGAERDYSGSRCRTEVDGVVNAGWLPWRSLGLPPLRDGFGELLWYAVGKAHHANSAVLLNSDTAGGLALNDGEEAVALLLAPGTPLDGAARPAAGFDALLHRGRYLEGENGDGDLHYVNGEGNDLLLPLERSRLLEVVERRVVAEAAALLTTYREVCGGYPEAAPLSGSLVSAAGLREGRIPLIEAAPIQWGDACVDGAAPRPPDWMAAWGESLFFAFVELPCEAGVNCLRLVDEMGVREDVEALVIVAGRDLGSGRPSSNWGDYLEGENASAGDGRFEQRAIGQGFNDRVRVVAP